MDLLQEIENEIKKLYKQTALKLAKDKKIKININVINSQKRKYSVFIGDSIIANHNNNSDEEEINKFFKSLVDIIFAIFIYCYISNR